jgi:hypothetical protein
MIYLQCFIVLVCELRENCQFPILPQGEFINPLREKAFQQGKAQTKYTAKAETTT